MVRRLPGVHDVVGDYSYWGQSERVVLIKKRRRLRRTKARGGANSFRQVDILVLAVEDKDASEALMRTM